LSKDYISSKVKNSEVNLIVAIPSKRRPDLVPNFAKRLAVALDVPFENAVQKIDIGYEQKELLNSAKQEENIKNSISIEESLVIGKTILLVDDMVDSRWSFTVIAEKLLEAGASAVYPFALVKTGSGD
jgi:ATP-dependent DNA helicase RecQ